MKNILLYSIVLFSANNIKAGEIEHIFVKINQPDSLKIDKKELQVSADGYYLGDYVSVKGGTAPFFYRWAPEDIFKDPTSQNPYWEPNANNNSNNNVLNLTVIDSNNCTAKTELKMVLTDIKTSLIELSYYQVQDFLFIHGESYSKIAIKVIDTSGNIILTDRCKNLPFKVDLTSLNKGIYIVMIECLEGTKIFKIIIDK